MQKINIQSFRVSHPIKNNNIVPVWCYKKWLKFEKCIISNDLFRDISQCRCHAWEKES